MAWLQERELGKGRLSSYLAGGHGVLVDALPALLGVHGHPGGAGVLLLQEVVLLPWEPPLCLLQLQPSSFPAAADPHYSLDEI